MKNAFNVVWKLRIWTDSQAQDFIEFALLAGFVAVVAAAIIPGVANNISEILIKIPSMMPHAGRANSQVARTRWDDHRHADFRRTTR